MSNAIPELAFRPATAADVDSLVSIDSTSPQPWTAKAFADELGRVPPTLFALSAGGRAIGFVAVRIHPPDLDIVNLAVALSWRRRGMGRTLLRKLLDQAAALGIENAFLEVREGNLEALALYRKAGFEEIQRRPLFYKDPPEDAILLRLQMTAFHA